MFIFNFTFNFFLNLDYLYNEYNLLYNVTINVYRNPSNQKY